MSEVQRRPCSNGFEGIRQDKNHFDDVVKMVRIGPGAQRPVDDVKLARHNKDLAAAAQQAGVITPQGSVVAFFATTAIGRKPCHDETRRSWANAA